MMYQLYFKRILDILISIFGLLFLSPLLLFIIFFLSIANSGRIFFIQERPGKNGEIFKIFKFKTMNDKKDEKGNLLPDAERLTTVGNFLRQTSLDEIPQFINVLKGEMSIIGPRPLLPFYLDLYNDFQRRRNEVKPGITGLAQVSGRNNLSWQKRFELDVEYVDKLSFLLDVKIFFLTLWKIVDFKNVNQDGFATSEEFNGNN